MKKGTIVLFGFVGIILIAGLSLSGCVTTHEVQGSKTDEGTIQQIEKGKTTRSEILKWFGEPDRTIGAGVAGESKTTVTGDVSVAQKQEITVGKNQEIYIYQYSETEKQFGVHNSRAERKNTLMIWIDKDTGIVQDYGYKKEI